MLRTKFWVQGTFFATGVSLLLDSHWTKLGNLFFLRIGEALYSQQKQDWELTVAQIMNSLLPNSD